LSEHLALAPERDISANQARAIGARALWQANVLTKELGINDPLTHLQQYLRHGEAALKSIDEDLITDIAERKLQPTFINPVRFDRQGDDFLSRENKFSMRQMTRITERKFAAGNLADARLYQRAKIESKEVDRLNKWFDTAETGDVFIVESMGLTETERYSIVRAHQKVSQTELIEHVITLHSSTVDVFNQLHRQLGADVDDSRNKLELLDKMYAYRPMTSDFPKEYVEAYDATLRRQNPGKDFNFGVPKGDNIDFLDDIEAIRHQQALRSVYMDNLKAIGTSDGYVTSDLLKIASQLGCNYELAEGSELSFSVARELMDRTLQSVVATFNRASKETLEHLAASQDKASAIASAGYYGGEARAEGVRYEGACPSGPGAAVTEQAGLAAGHRFNKDPAQCGDCPKCGKEYYVPPQIYKQKIVHCNGCNSAISFGNEPVNWKVIENFYGQKKPQIGLLEMLSLAVKKAGLEVKIDQLKQKHQMSETEFQRRRTEQLLEQNYKELETIKEVI
jgi:hypothetical protein